MKIYSDNKKQWFIKFYSDFYSMPLYKNYESIKDLCEAENIKRKDFELYYNTKY